MQKPSPSSQAYRALPLACLLGLLLPSAAAGATTDPSPAGAASLAAQVANAKEESSHGVRRHYMWSNERRHDLFFGDLAGVGGGYLGVGGDQNYSMAAAAGAKVLWLIDLDVAVVRMHRLYAALLAAADSPAAFLTLLDARHKQAVYDAVAAYHAALSEDERRAVLSIYHAYREDLSQHLHATAEFRWGSRPVTWLADPAMYSHLRKLAMERLIVPRLGDLAGPEHGAGDRPGRPDRGRPRARHLPFKRRVVVPLRPTVSPQHHRATAAIRARWSCAPSSRWSLPTRMGISGTTASSAPITSPSI